MQEFCLITTNLGKCLLYIPLDYKDDCYASTCKLNISKLSTLLCTLQQFNGHSFSSTLRFHNYNVVTADRSDIIISLFKPEINPSAIPSIKLKLKQMLNVFLFYFCRPITTILRLEKELLIQEMKRYVFKLKDEEKDELMINRYSVFEVFKDYVAFTVNSPSLEEVWLSPLMSFKLNNIVKILLLDSSTLNILLKKVNLSFCNNPIIFSCIDQKIDFNQYIWLYISACCNYFYEEYFNSNGVNNIAGFNIYDDLSIFIGMVELEKDHFTFLLIYYYHDKLDVSTNRFTIPFRKENNGEFISSLEINEIVNMKEIVTEDFLNCFNETLDIISQSFYNSYPIVINKEEIDKEWNNNNIQHSISKNGRKFLKTKKLSLTTIVTPNEDDMTKYTPRPPEMRKSNSSSSFVIPSPPKLLMTSKDDNVKFKNKMKRLATQYSSILSKKNLFHHVEQLISPVAISYYHSTLFTNKQKEVQKHMKWDRIRERNRRSIRSKGNSRVNAIVPLPTFRPSFFHLLQARNINGHDFRFRQLKDKVCILCPFTFDTPNVGDQIHQLNKLYYDFRARGLEVLLFPTKDETKTTNEIRDSFVVNHGDPGYYLFDKIELSERDPVIEWLMKKSGRNEIKPLDKFLVDKHGNLIESFNAEVHPESMRPKIEEIIKT
ncbi:hypothetical protein ABK040_009784 [Willaertia magna]